METFFLEAGSGPFSLPTHLSMRIEALEWSGGSLDFSEEGSVPNHCMRHLKGGSMDAAYAIILFTGHKNMQIYKSKYTKAQIRKFKYTVKGTRIVEAWRLQRPTNTGSRVALLPGKFLRGCYELSF